MPFAAALSEHPVPATAVGEVVGEVLEALGPAPDLAVLFLTVAHAGAIEDAAAVVRTVLAPGTLVGCAAESVLAGRREVEEQPGVVLWAARVGPVEPVLLQAPALPPDPPFEPSALLLLADPFTFAAPELFDLVAERWPGLPVVGGNASGARGPGGNRLLLDSTVATGGAVGAFLGPGVEVEAVTSQGCRPIGDPFVVTSAEEHVLRELGGKPALERLLALAPSLPERDIQLINAGRLHVGRVIDEHKAEFDAHDFLTMNVLGADRSAGAIAVAGEVEVGTTVQFQVRDALSADEDLRALLAGREADAALVFTCNGRGTRLFGERHHDARAVADLLHGPPAAGFFAAGEFGPVGGRNFVHGFTASLALFRDARSAS